MAIASRINLSSALSKQTYRIQPSLRKKWSVGEAFSIFTCFDYNRCMYFSTAHHMTCYKPKLSHRSAEIGLV